LVNSEEIRGSISTKDNAIDAVVHSSPTRNGGGSGIGFVPSPVKTAEEIIEEEESIQIYKERKLRAKKRRDDKQKQEMQKVLDEKRMIEEELEELKQNLLSDKLGQQQQQQQQRPSSNTGNYSPIRGEEDEIDEFAAKKLQKLKKRYEKKLNATKEELEDLREVSILLSCNVFSFLILLFFLVIGFLLST
jgi:alanyl-tRNA synthetase